jgi:hypothetical protein
MCGIIPGETDAMQFHHFLSVKRIQKLSKRDEKVFTEARELALLRLEQCIAYLPNPVPAMRSGIRSPGGSATEKTHESRLGLFRESPDCQCALTPVFNSCPMAMATEEIINSLRASSGRLMRVTFSDGIVQTVIIGTIDKAGFLHRGIDSADPQVFWTRFEDVDALEAENYSSCVESMSVIA